MRRGSQCPHMHVEFVGQDLKRHPIIRWPLRLRHPRLADDGLWRVRPEVGQQQVSRLTMGHHHGIDLARLNQVAQKAGVID